MDDSPRKILHFLQQNINCQFETSDIAFYLKMDEAFTAQALDYLQSNKMIRGSTDSSGRVYWQVMDGHSHETNTLNSQLSNQLIKKDRKVLEKIKKPSIPVSSFMYFHLVVTIGIVIGLCYFVFSGKVYIDNQIENVNGLVKTSIPVQGYAEFREKFVQYNEIFQKEITVLHSQLENAMGQIDSLKEIVTHLRTEPEPYKRRKY